MSDPMTVSALFAAHRDQLELAWVNEATGGERTLTPVDEHAPGANLVGHLSLIRPNQIQVLGDAELDYFANLGKNSGKDALERLFATRPALLIITDARPVSPELLNGAQAAGIAVFSSALAGQSVIAQLQYYLAEHFAETVTLHGVFMEVMGIGVLLSGPSGIGKSELALELLSRGHRLIADDAPEFYRAAPDILAGTCPEPLQGFLEVRGLGVLNIRAMYGDNALKATKYLRLIVRLEYLSELDVSTLDRLQGTRHNRTVLGVNVPELLIPIAPGRNMAVIIEAAVRNHILYVSGYNAARDFMDRQQRHISDQSS